VYQLFAKLFNFSGWLIHATNGPVLVGLIIGVVVILIKNYFKSLSE